MDIHEWCTDEQLAEEEPVASLLRAAAAPSEPGPLPGEDAALAAFRATRHTTGRKPVRSTKMKTVFAAAVSAGVLLTGGVAAAAVTGNITMPGHNHLPTQAENGNVPSEVPSDAATDAAESDAQQTGDTEAPDPQATDSSTGDNATTEDTESADPTAQGKPEDAGTHGTDVSSVAKDKSKVGDDGHHGSAVSGVASNGKSQAGEHGQSGDHSQAGDHSGAGAESQSEDATDTQSEGAGEQQSEAGDNGATHSGDNTSGDTTQQGGTGSTSGTD